MTYTTADISALDNSMEAARNFGNGLGTELNWTSASLATVVAHPVVASASFSGSTVNIITTGLTTVTGVVAGLSGSPTLEHAWNTAVSGSTAGDIYIYAWKPTSDSDGTPVAADNNFVDGYWIAVGT